MKPRIAIIGAGISGLAAAKHLHNNGLADVQVFEATNRIGGRIQTLNRDDGSYIELGAQWIHGQENNSVYEYGERNRLLASVEDDFSVEGQGTYCDEHGRELNCDILQELITFLDSEKRNMDAESGQTVQEFFNAKFLDFIAKRSSLVEQDELTLLTRAFRWFIIFELIDNSCDSLQTLSPLSYTEWEDCDGIVDLINLKSGYSSLVDLIAGSLPKNCVKLNSPVHRIRFNSTGSLSLLLEDQKQEFDHVIVTCSLGFLKQNHERFFEFSLPEEKLQVMEHLGFGTINKIFLSFSEPFWFEDENSFQIIWSDIEDCHSFSSSKIVKTDSEDDELEVKLRFPLWAYSIQSFDLVRGQPNMLLGWIGSTGAVEMETRSDEEILDVCHEILKAVVPTSRRQEKTTKTSISKPELVHVTRWNTNPWMCGAYSNRTIAYENLDFGLKSNIEALHKPIFYPEVPGISSGSGKPAILFAGEATDRMHYSTTHGAYDSGVREANRIIEFYN